MAGCTTSCCEHNTIAPSRRSRAEVVNRKMGLNVVGNETGVCTTYGQIYRPGEVHLLCVQTLKGRHRPRLAIGTIGAAAGIEDTVDPWRHSNRLGRQRRIAPWRQARPIAQRQRTGQHGRVIGCHSCGNWGCLWRREERCSELAARCRHCTFFHSRCWSCDRAAVRK